MSNRKYIYVDGKRVYISDEVYNVLKKQKNGSEYLERLDRKHLISNFSEVSIENIADERVDVEKIVQMKILIEKMRRAMRELTDDELDIVQKIYFDDESLSDVANSKNISYFVLVRKRDKILKKLRKLIGD